MPTDFSATDADWRRSSYCVGESNCVEVAEADSVVHLRSSQRPDRLLTFGKDDWRAFLETIKAGAYPES